MTNSPLPSPADTPNLADIRAKFTGSWDTVDRAVTEATEVDAEAELEIVPCPTPPGFVVWRIVGTEPRTMLPRLLLRAPPRVQRGYFARVLSNLTGRCPICAQTAWISANAPDPETHPAGWARLEISFGVEHIARCGAVFDDSDRRWFDPRAVPR